MASGDEKQCSKSEEKGSMTKTISERLKGNEHKPNAQNPKGNDTQNDNERKLRSRDSHNSLEKTNSKERYSDRNKKGERNKRKSRSISPQGGNEKNKRSHISDEERIEKQKDRSKSVGNGKKTHQIIHKRSKSDVRDKGSHEKIEKGHKMNESDSEESECEVRSKRQKFSRHKRQIHNISDSEEMFSDENNNYASEKEIETIRELKEKLRKLEKRPSHHFSFYEEDVLKGSEDMSLNNANRSYADFTGHENSILQNISLVDSQENDNSDDFISIFNEGIDSVPKGKPLTKDAMFLVQNFFDKEPDSNITKTIRDRYPEPENCVNLSGKTVNHEIYRCLNSYVRKKDFCLKGIQGTMATASIANLKLVETITDLYKTKNIPRETANVLLKYASDSTKVLSKGYSDISIFRKLLMRPHMQFKYQQLCGKRTFGNLLFGDDLAKEIKEIDEESKLIRNVGKPYTRGYRQQPYNTYDHNFAKNLQGRGRGYTRTPYRGRRGSYRSRGRIPQQSVSHTQEK